MNLKIKGKKAVFSRIQFIFGVMFVSFLLFTAPLRAGSKIRWVEVDVVLDQDAEAQISYMVRWSCSNASLHGFYFEGFAGVPVFDYENAYAVDELNNRYLLEIKKIGSKKYDIVLANGQAFSNGEITYFFRYNTNLETSGNVTQTSHPEGLLAVFNWAPVQWEDAFEHETVTVHYPVILSHEIVTQTDLASYRFMTEKYVNQRYLIDYPTAIDASGRPVLTVRFHKNHPGRRYHFQIQTYMDAKYYTLSTISMDRSLREGQRCQTSKRKLYSQQIFSRPNNGPYEN